MKILAAGLDDITIGFLTKNGIAAEREDLEDGASLEEWLHDRLYEAAVIDLDTSGLGVYAARELREKRNDTPIIGLAKGGDGRSWSEFRANFLENGADDLLRSPANPRELVATLRAVTRRFKGSLLDIGEYRKGGAVLKINHTILRVTINGVEPHLTNKHLQMLLVLARAPGRTLSKSDIISQLYTAGLDDEPAEKIVDVFICKIRKTFEELHPDAKDFIETVWGRGYRFATDDTAAAAQASTA